MNRRPSAILAMLAFATAIAEKQPHALGEERRREKRPPTPSQDAGRRAYRYAAGFSTEREQARRVRQMKRASAKAAARAGRVGAPEERPHAALEEAPLEQ